jgi:hypothetical protein
LGYDLEVFTKKHPEHAHVAEFVDSHAGLSLEGKLEPPESNIIVSRMTDAGSEAIVEIWGPDNAESEDLADIVAETIRPPYWLVQVAAPAPQADTVKLAESIATHVAQRCDGIVYDPQAEAIVWPKVNVVSPSRSSRNERIRIVTLTWYLPASQASTSMARTFLRTVGNLCPRAVPTRFGVYHPLQGKLRPGEEQPFVDSVEEILQSERSDMIELRSKAPCFGGYLWIPSRRPDLGKMQRSRDVTLELNFDGRVIESDPKSCEKIVELFVELARSLKAFYANGYVERGVFASRGGLGYDEESEQYPKPAGRWKGIPSVPYWLNWFGDPYFGLVKNALDSPEASHFEDGILIRLGAKPRDFDQLRNSHLRLPPELVSDMRINVVETRYPSGITMRHNEWEASLAKSVPDMD